jgi:hypothetical protein
VWSQCNRLANASVRQLVLLETSDQLNNCSVRYKEKAFTRMHNLTFGLDKILHACSRLRLSSSFNLRSTKASLALAAVFFLTLVLQPLQASNTAVAADFERDPAAETLFKNIWDKSDGAIAGGKATRSWLWGPGPYLVAREEYKESPGGTRYVMYFDKARMELTRPANSTVTNGLLVVEMMRGEYQDGDTYFVKAKDGAAQTSTIGDPGNWLTYAKFAPYASIGERVATNRAPDRTGQTADDELTQDNKVVRASRAAQQKLGYYEATLGHNIPQVFWDFLNQQGTVYDGGAKKFVNGAVVNWLADAGYAITEPFWVKQKVGGVVLFKVRVTPTYSKQLVAS